ncbi:MAG: hypothetical protein JOZ85_03195 [Betaproteobacteria bacterium]|nr:hypothetical protein [Betaproteobacteria bacterium]
MASFLAPTPLDIVAAVAWIGAIVTLLGVRSRIRVITGSPQIRDRSAPLVTVIAAALAMCDAFFFSQGVFAIALCLAGLLYYVPRAIGARPDPSLFRLRVVKAAVVTFSGAAAIVVIVAFNNIAEGRAGEVIAAAENFKARFGRYPETLDELVPLFMSEVPKAKPAGMMRTFDYRVLGEEHTLMYTVVPPFGRKVYTFERKRWSALD